MKRNILMLVLLLMATTMKGQTFPFQDTSLGIEERVEDLLSRLTLDEKMSMMEHRNPAVPSLGLPAYSWWNEALHGVARNGLATVWPMPVALAATFDVPLVYNVFSETALEGRTKYNAARIGDTCVALREAKDNTGITFFTPNINIFRDPRWGRGMETYGEDPHLAAMMGLACVWGLQHAYEVSDYPRGLESASRQKLSAAACLKHLAVHSGPEGVRHEFDSRVSPRDMHTTYLPAFEYIIRHSDVQQVMCGYNRLNGEPCCTNRELLVDLLRHEWGYDGLIVTDCWALNDCWERDTVIPRHKTHPTAAMTAAAAFGGEVDLECGSGLEAIRTAVDSGYISEQTINKHVRRILRTRLRVEMEDDREVSEPMPSPTTVAAEALVLLKNNRDLLPLQKGVTKVYLAGPNTDDTLMPLGNYNGTPHHTVSIREGMMQQFVMVENPKMADVIVYAGGLSPQLEGEELQVDMPGFYKGDRTLIELPEAQRKEIKKLRRQRKPMILLLCSGSAIALGKEALKSDAIVACWYGGQDMGKAVAMSLAGEYDCFGRLPVTFYKSTRQLPPFESYDMCGRTYRYMTDKPLYAFGYGLNYAKYHIENVKYSQAEKCIKGSIVMDKPACSGVDTRVVVQAYKEGDIDKGEPVRSLVGFVSVELNGSGADFSIPIDEFWLRNYDDGSQRMVAPLRAEKVRLSIGLSSDDDNMISVVME